MHRLLSTVKFGTLLVAFCLVAMPLHGWWHTWHHSWHHWGTHHWGWHHNWRHYRHAWWVTPSGCRAHWTQWGYVRVCNGHWYWGVK